MRTGRLSTVGLVVAAGWLVVWAVIDAVFGSRTLSFSAFFGVTPLFVAAVCSWPLTAAAGIAAVALAVGSGGWHHNLDSAHLLVPMCSVLVVAAVAVVVSVLRVRRETAFSQLSVIAELAQRAVLPVLPSRTNGVRLATRYQSATLDALVGGDLYDAVILDTDILVLVGDVAGKGVTAVQQAARVIRAFRQWAGVAPDLATLAWRMNEYLQPFFTDEEFVTAVVLNVAEPGTLQLVSCGHPPPLLVAQNAISEVEIDEVAAPLGLMKGLPTVTRRPWPADTRLLLYTDGLIETRDRTGHFLPQERIRAALTDTDPDRALDSLLAEVALHAYGQVTDDVALLLLDHSSGHSAA